MMLKPARSCLLFALLGALSSSGALAADDSLGGLLLQDDGELAQPLHKGARPGASPASGGDLLQRMGIEPPVAGGGTLAPDARSGRIGAADRATILHRMAEGLPDLSPEKPYTGVVDEAYGAYQRGLYVTALQKALPRAQLGDAVAQTLVGVLLSRGLGVPRDAKAAAFWFKQAAENDDPPAMFRYALLLMEGEDVPRDKAKADEMMKKAAEAGNASAQFNYAQMLVADNPGERGLEQALPYYEKSAEQGIADAQYAVSQVYMSLPDIPEDKRAKAREWLLRAARAGYDTAQLDMGVWLVNGVGGPRDFDKGFQWLRIAALRGNVAAQNKLAYLYINALGTRPDPVEAAKWYVLSRRAGLVDPGLEDFYLGLTDEQQKQAIDAANKFRPI